MKYGCCLGNSKCSCKGVEKISYKYWSRMIDRSFGENYKKERESYKGVSCCEEWKIFSNFEKWFDENYYTVPNNERMHLDKDILLKNNKIYCPNNCIFVPQTINSLFTKNNKNRNDLPIGVTRSKGKYRSALTMDGKTYNLGYSNSVEDAFLKYKLKKEEFIKEIAERYKNYIPSQLYNSLYNWIVEIDD